MRATYMNSKTGYAYRLASTEANSRYDTEVSFGHEFRKAKERTPATRAEFQDVRVVLVGDTWQYELTESQRKGKVSPLGLQFQVFGPISRVVGDEGSTRRNPGPLRYRGFKVACNGGRFYSGEEHSDVCLSLNEKGAMKFRPSPSIPPVMVPWRDSRKPRQRLPPGADRLHRPFPNSAIL